MTTKKIEKLTASAGWEVGHGFDAGAVYGIPSEGIVIRKAAGRWMILHHGVRVGSKDRLEWAKDLALEIAR